MNRGIPRATWANSPATDKATLREIVFKALVKTGQVLDHTFVVDMSISRWTGRYVTVNDVRVALQNLVSTAGQVPFQRDRVTDSTARQVYAASVQGDVDSVARFLGISGKRVDVSHLALVTVREAISK